MVLLQVARSISMVGLLEEVEAKQPRKRGPYKKKSAVVA